MEPVLIVGASSGIGSEISTLFRCAYVQVITTHTSTPPGGANAQADPYLLDRRDNRSIETFAQKLIQLTPKINITIFLAGIFIGQEPWQI
jgi:NAD(P)-dependent dehydrogenase (short-subunit alcohol dehydrogenase family)